MNRNRNTKLTLNIDKEVIEEAKTYAKEKNTSLSNLVENFLNSLTKKSERKSKKISPLVESLTGVIPSEEIDERKSYRDYLTEKYS